MNDREAVVAANRTFYDAFESLDVGKMESVWLQDQRIVCIHPGWRKLLGWGAVMTSWERIFESAFEMKFELGEMDVMIIVVITLLPPKSTLFPYTKLRRLGLGA